MNLQEHAVFEATENAFDCLLTAEDTLTVIPSDRNYLFTSEMEIVKTHLSAALEQIQSAIILCDTLEVRDS